MTRSAVSFVLVLLAAGACDSRTLVAHADAGRSPRDASSSGDGASPVDVAPVSQSASGGQCPDGYVACGSDSALRCYDLSRSQDHCGACGIACSAGVDCQDGACQQRGCRGALSFNMIVLGSTGAINAIGDFDGDGIPDLIGTVDPYSSMRILYGIGDGTFTQGPLIPDDPPVWPDAGAPTFTTGRMAIAADLDGDGHLDLLSATVGEVSLKVRRGTGSRAVPFGDPTFYPSPNGLFSLVLSDFDQDGRIDLAAGDSQGLEFWRGQAGGGFERPLVLGIGATAGPSGAIAAAWVPGILVATDWNGDGFLDLVYGGVGFQGTEGSVVLGANTRLYYRLGHGDGTFDGEVTCALTMGIVGDFDHDNRPDVISSSSIKGATLSLGINGCSASKVVPITDWTKEGGVALADFNGDGNLDVVIDDNKAIMVHVGDGKGGFPHALTFPAPTLWDWDFGSFLVGDLNRDGKLDIVFARKGGWGVLLNTCQ